MEKQISHFQILEEIGSGGMGVVYRANDLRLKRKVALKVLPAGALAEPTIRERLVREAQTASALNHPHIVTVFEIHSAGDRDFIAMEFVKGRSLDRLIGDEGLELERALRYGVQIADGLACAHEHGVIHRDLKPQNVMITPSDDVKILDFGLAKRFMPEGVQADSSGLQPAMMTLTAPGVKVGTPAYMSPEQIESRGVDARSDVFSFGALLYEMLSGVSPFHRRNAILIFKAVLSDAPGPIHALKPELPAELGGILVRALEKDPGDRYPDMRRLLADLEAVHAKYFGTGIYPSQSGAFPVPSPPLAEAKSRRRPALMGLGVAAAAALAWLASRPPTPPVLAGHVLLSTAELTPLAARLAPNGERVAFAAVDAAGLSQVWTQPVDGPPATRLTSAAFAAIRPSWAADGGSLVFAERGGGIWSVGAEGGPPVRLLEVGVGPRPSPDGERLAIEHDGRLWLAAAGGDLVELASVPPAFFAHRVPRAPAFSPDGRSLAYFQPEAGADGGLWVAPVAGGEPRRLFAQTFRGGDPAWTADGRWIVFAADLDGPRQLWCVPAGGGDPVRLTQGAGRAGSPDVAAHGHRIVYSVSRSSFALERADPGGEELQLLISDQEIVRPEVSPAGVRIAFSAPAGDDEHLFVVDAATGVLRQVTRGSGESNVLPRWSADGAHLYFYQRRPVPSLRKVAAAGGRSSELVARWSVARQYGAAVAPGEDRVVYVPLAGGAPEKARLRDLESGEERELGTTLLDPRWSPDGREILGADAADRIYLCPAAGGDCRFLAEGSRPQWRADGGSITFLRAGAPAEDAAWSIWAFTPESGEARRLHEVEGAALLDLGYRVLPDGGVIWNRELPGRVELWLAELE